MIKIQRALFIIAVTAACTANVERYVSNCTEPVPCTCSAGLHGIEACNNGNSAATCACTPAVTPQIEVQGNPQALSEKTTYTASVAASAGLVHTWTISGGSLDSTPTGDSVNLTTGPAGSLLLTVNTVNTGGDAAAPTTATFTVVTAPPSLKAGDVQVATTLTAMRASVPATVLAPQNGVAYHWRQDGDATLLQSDGTRILLDAGTSAFTLFVSAVTSAGIASNELAIPIAVVSPRVEVIAGTPGGFGDADDQGADARFFNTNAIAHNAKGIFVLDNGDANVRLVSASFGVSTIASLASVPSELPPFVTMTAQDDNTLLLGASNGDGEYSNALCDLYTLTNSGTLAPYSAVGAECSPCFDGATLTSSFPEIDSLITDGATVYAANRTTVFVLHGAGHPATLYNTNASYDCAGTQLAAIQAIAKTSAGLYALEVDSENAIDRVVMVPANGSAAPTMIAQLATTGATPDVGFSQDMTADDNGNLWIMRPGQIVLVNPSDQSVTVVAGDADDLSAPTPVDGVASSATFVGSSPVVLYGADAGKKKSSIHYVPGVSGPGSGALYVGDDDSTVRQVSHLSAGDPLRGTVTTVAGSAPHYGDADRAKGASNTALFSELDAIAVDAKDSIYVLDTSAVPFDFGDLDPVGNCKIKRLDPDQSVTTIAGNKCADVATAGRALHQSLGVPVAMAVDAHDTAYFTDGLTASLREVTADGLLLSAAGVEQAVQTTPQQADGFATSAIFGAPSALAVGPTGEVAINDIGDNPHDNEASTIRLFLQGQIVTISDEDCDSGGCQLTFDTSGNLYAADPFANTPRIFELAVPDYEEKDLVMGTTTPCTPAATEDCASACLIHPGAMAVDNVTGDLFFADNELVRRVHQAATCTVSTVAGMPGLRGFKTGTDLASARLNAISGLAFSPLSNDLYAIDQNEQIVLRIRFPALAP